MQKGKKNKDGKFPTQSYSKISSGSSIIIPCVIVNSNKQRARRLRLAFCSLSVAAVLLFAAASCPGDEGDPQCLKDQVWEDKMFKPNLVVVSVILSQVADDELWDVLLGFILHVSIRTHLRLGDVGRCRIHHRSVSRRHGLAPVWDVGGSNIIVSSRRERRRGERPLFKQVQKLSGKKSLSQLMKTAYFSAVFKSVFPPPTGRPHVFGLG